MGLLKVAMGDGGVIWFETGDEVVPPGPQPVSRFSSAAEATIQALDDSINGIQAAALRLVERFRSDVLNPPDEVKIEFGIKASAEIGAFVIAKAHGDASYSITATWRKATSPAE
jgi:hypothetical protein